MNSDYPGLDVQILGINQISHEAGNADTSEGRDIPWLQDVDDDGDRRSDVWLNSWAYAYRDVVIVDADNVPVDVFNLTTHDLGQGESYAMLRQLFLDAAVSVTTGDELVQAPPATTIDINVLGNDGTSGEMLTISGITPPTVGTADIVTLDVPVDLAPRQANVRPFVISEVRPGEFIELFHAGYHPTDISAAGISVVSGTAGRPIGDLTSTEVAPPRSYLRLDWPSEFTADPTSGELLLARGEFAELTAGRIDDFVAWGSHPETSHRLLAVAGHKWSGDPAEVLASGSIHRRPATSGVSRESYDSSQAASPEAALNGQVESLQLVRFIPPDGFSGVVDLRYGVRNPAGGRGVGSLSIEVAADARPWQNPVDPLDVNNDGVRAPQDVLHVINALNQGFVGTLPAPSEGLVPLPFLDCNGNNSIEPADALEVINGLNGPTGEGEANTPTGGGEAAASSPPVLTMMVDPSPLAQSASFDRRRLPPAADITDIIALERNRQRVDAALGDDRRAPREWLFARVVVDDSSLETLVDDDPLLPAAHDMPLS